MSIFETSADCREMKHQTCYGRAWNDATDSEGECQCNCHEPEEVVVAPVDPIQVWVYVEPLRNAESADTLRALKRMDISHRIVEVVSGQGVLPAEFKLAAAELGVKVQLPCVEVYDPNTEDTDTWFGYLPDKIRELRGKITNSQGGAS
ncbi:hypothetical protein [Arthrobacter sp. MYb213]|uniref:hypothetical protein n=1 Tax=Arthrobacter sp. MYb213 TaxID=1848595 RepID=UPI000CFD7D74|nr:hypothetical protein [Arthrobacter sp. MYb213]PRB69499.1 hypothetical protein CQ011_12110 [Arthrobacter sp. MYb213]